MISYFLNYSLQMILDKNTVLCFSEMYCPKVYKKLKNLLISYRPNKLNNGEAEKKNAENRFSNFLLIFTLKKMSKIKIFQI